MRLRSHEGEVSARADLLEEFAHSSHLQLSKVHRPVSVETNLPPTKSVPARLCCGLSRCPPPALQNGWC